MAAISSAIASFAASVGNSLAKIHADCANNDSLKRLFSNDDIFFKLRLEPYFLECATVQPNVANYLRSLVNLIQSKKITLIHGDVSPKNILVGPKGPIFLDAECATYGDPAFDVAFCLHHLLLKSVMNPFDARLFLEAFHALAHAYLLGVYWESCESIEARITGLIPALILARISGKSPVDYLNPTMQQRAFVIAMTLISSHAVKLEDIEELTMHSIDE